MMRYCPARANEAGADLVCGLNQLRQLARHAAVAVSHQFRCDGPIYRLTSDQLRDRYGRV